MYGIYWTKLYGPDTFKNSIKFFAENSKPAVIANWFSATKFCLHLHLTDCSTVVFFQLYTISE